MKGLLIIVALAGIGISELIDADKFIVTLDGSGGCGVNEILQSNTSECVCAPGYVNISGTCTNPCDDVTCPDQTFCSPLSNGSYVCQDPCANAACFEHSSPTASGTNCECVCEATWSGTNCTNQEICQTNVCNGHGQCTQGKVWNDYNCTCNTGYSGNNCQYKEICQTAVCGANGYCEQGMQWSNYTCKCENGYVGANCTTYDLCSVEPVCSGHGNCITADEESKCDCETSYEGTTCSSSVAGQCENTPCSKNQDCTPTETGYECYCKVGFVGDNCEPDPCSEDPCNSNGICESQLDADIGSHIAVCDCFEGWGTTWCNLENYCSTTDACNGGACVQQGQPDKFTCTCQSGFDGVVCDIPVCEEIKNFPRSLAGETVSSLKTCSSGPFDGKPAGTNKCILEGTAAHWEGEKQVDCSISDLESITDPVKKIDTVTAITSDPEQVNNNDVDNAVAAITDITSSEIIEAEAADGVVASISNLLNDHVSAEASSNVVQQSSEILESLDKMAETVTLQTDQQVPNVASYSSVESELALTVLQTSARYFRLLKSSKSNPCWWYRIKKTLSQDDGLAGVEPEYGNDCNGTETEGTSHYVTTDNSNKASFMTFQNDQLYNETKPETTGFINSIILSVNTKGNIILKFQLFQFFELDPNGRFENGSNSLNATCVQWVNNSTWSSASCTTTAILKGRNYFTVCNCPNSSGNFATKMVSGKATVIVKDKDNNSGNGLSDGEIAGIVVGSVAAVGLIAGGSYAAYTTSKKKSTRMGSSNRIRPGPAVEEEMEIIDGDDN